MTASLSLLLILLVRGETGSNALAGGALGSAGGTVAAGRLVDRWRSGSSARSG